MTLLPLAGTFVVGSASGAYAERGGNGNGKNDRERSNNGNRNSGAASQTTAGVAPASNGKGRGALASELKGLNAAHANPNAFANASPNSQVGRVGAYYFASLETEEARAALAALGLDPDNLDLSTIGDQETILGQLATLDPAGESYDALAAEALLVDLGYEPFAPSDPLLDPASDAYMDEHNMWLANTSLAASGGLADDLVIAEAAGDYLDLLDTEESTLASLTPGRILSEAALAELRRLLGLS